MSNAENGYATIFGYYVNDPERFGIMEFNEDGRILSVEEKPSIQRVITVSLDSIFMISVLFHLQRT